MTEINMFKHARDVEVKQPGDDLFLQGDPGDVMFAVIEGEVELVLDGQIIDAIGPGGIVGEMALVDSSPRSATAKVRTEARLARVGQEEFTFLVQEHPSFALLVMRVMAERLRKANTRRVDA